MVLHHALMLPRVVAVPAVPLPVPAEINALDELVGLDVGAGPFCAELAGAGETFFGFVCGGAAVGACAFAVFGGGGGGFEAAVVPFLGGEVVGFGFLEALMLDWGVLVCGIGGGGGDVR